MNCRLGIWSSHIDDTANNQQNAQTLSMDLHIIFPCCDCKCVASPTGYRCCKPSSRLLHGTIVIFITEAQISDLFLWWWQIHWHFQRVACREGFSKSKTAMIASPILHQRQTKIVSKHGGSSNGVMTCARAGKIEQYNYQRNTCPGQSYCKLNYVSG